MGSPFPLEIVRAVSCPTPRLVEKLWHKHFQRLNENREWFGLSDEQVGYIHEKTCSFDQTGSFDDENLDEMFKSIQARPVSKKSAVKTLEENKETVRKKVDGSSSHRQEIRPILQTCKREVQDVNMNRRYIEKEEDDFEAILKALELHPEATEKIGVGVKSFFVQISAYGSYCFHVKRIDGTEEDFSYIWCFFSKKPTHHTDYYTWKR